MLIRKKSNTEENKKPSGNSGNNPSDNKELSERL